MSFLYFTFISSRIFFCDLFGDHLDLHRLTHSSPTRRSSDLVHHHPAHGRPTTAPLHRRHVVETHTGDHGAGTFALGCIGGEQRLDRVSFGLLEIAVGRSEEHTSELQSLMRISYAVFCLKQKTANNNT